MPITVSVANISTEMFHWLKAICTIILIQLTKHSFKVSVHYISQNFHKDKKKNEPKADRTVGRLHLATTIHLKF